MFANSDGLPQVHEFHLNKQLAFGSDTAELNCWATSIAEFMLKVTQINRQIKTAIGDG